MYVRNLPDGVQQTIIRCYSKALHLVFILPLVAAGLGFVSILFAKKVRFLGRHRKDEETQERQNKQGENRNNNEEVKQQQGPAEKNIMVATGIEEKITSDAPTESDVCMEDVGELSRRNLSEHSGYKKNDNRTEKYITNRIKSFMHYER